MVGTRSPRHHHEDTGTEPQLEGWSVAGDHDQDVWGELRVAVETRTPYVTTCVVCGCRIIVMEFRGTGVCSGRCEKAPPNPHRQEHQGGVVKFWRNNRLDGEFDMPIEHVADLYAGSRWAQTDWPLDRKLRIFLTDHGGPINAVWDADDPAYDDLLRLIAHRSASAVEPSYPATTMARPTAHGATQ